MYRGGIFDDKFRGGTHLFEVKMMIFLQEGLENYYILDF